VIELGARGIDELPFLFPQRAERTPSEVEQGRKRFREQWPGRKSGAGECRAEVDSIGIEGGHAQQPKNAWSDVNQ
jgi:hypothetical protein